ncbi:hypothetical protein [Actinomycetospora atypica]|uniref:Gram-positive cocci surface proteins LPxTG domain-containing protein n=1 Tax=Actinomycetospora atypica TaxID=1290095 RepID=A0ABV9YSE7_9PSEU
MAPAAFAGIALAALAASPGTTVAATTPLPAAPAVVDVVPAGTPSAADDVLWYGLLSGAALAGAAGATQFVGRPRRV